MEILEHIIHCTLNVCQELVCSLLFFASETIFLTARRLGERERHNLWRQFC